MITKGQTIKINGKKVVVDGVNRTKFGTAVYFYSEGEYLWVYAHELTLGM